MPHSSTSTLKKTNEKTYTEIKKDIIPEKVTSTTTAQAKYEKKNGIVQNTSTAAYEKAKQTKKENNERIQQEKDNNEVLSVLKHEVPADIAELKAKVAMIMEVLGLTEKTT